MMRRPAQAVAVASLLLLAACAGGEQRPGATSLPPDSESAWPPPVSESQTPPPVVAALPRPAEPLPTSPPEDPRRLVGLSGDTLRSWLGEQAFVRRDRIAEIWTFATETCFLDVFLYREGEALRVNHLEARSRVVGQRATLQSCYGRIMAGRPKATS